MTTELTYWTIGALAIVLLAIWRLQTILAEKRRYMTALWLELAAHEETLSICERANYAIPLVVRDWPWIRYFLAGSVDPDLLSDVSAYYSAVETAWNLSIKGGGQAPDPHQQRILRSLSEANSRVYKRIEEEVKLLYQPRRAWNPWVRKLLSAQARLRQRVAHQAQKSKV